MGTSDSLSKESDFQFCRKIPENGFCCDFSEELHSIFLLIYISYHVYDMKKLLEIKLPTVFSAFAIPIVSSWTPGSIYQDLKTFRSNSGTHCTRVANKRKLKDFSFLM